MAGYYWYNCSNCHYRAERYRNIKKCPLCGGKLIRLEPEFACYHITTRDRLDSILEDGLVPNSKPNWFTAETPYVMLSLYPYWWLYGNAVLIEIKDPAIRREYFSDPEGLRWNKIIKPEYFNAVIECRPSTKFEKSKGRKQTNE